MPRIVWPFLCCMFINAAFAQIAVETEPVVGIKSNPPRVFILANASVVVSPEKRLENATVVVNNGMIAAVGQRMSMEIAGAQAIDMSGQTIYAGFIDGYGELEMPKVDSGAAYWNDNVAPQRKVASALERDDDAVAKYREQGITVRLLAPGDGLVKGQSALVAMSDVEPTASILVESVAQHIALTPKNRSWRSKAYPGSPMGAVALVRQSLYDMQWYTKAWEAYNADPSLTRPEANDALAELAGSIERDLPFIVDASNERFVMRAGRLAEEFDLTILLRGSGREYRRLDEVASLDAAILLPVDYPKAPDVSTVDAALNASLEQLMHWDHAPENAARLAAANVRFALTTDGLKSPGEFLAAVRKTIRRGLPAETALAALTTMPADFFGVAERMGTIEVGKMANLVVADGDLFDVDADESAKVVETWVDGVRFEHERNDAPDLRGKWDVVFLMDGGRQVKGELHLLGKPKKLSGKLIVKDEEAKLKQVSFAEQRLRLAVDAQSLGGDGQAILTFVVIANDLTSEVVTGQGTLPDGSRLTATLRQTMAGEIKESKGKDKGKASDDDEPDDGGGESESEDRESEEGDDAESGKGKKKKSAQDLASSFVVNYPLGAFGREETPVRQDVAFVNATVWTCEDAGKLKNATVLIVDGKIKAIGDGDKVDLPSACKVVDCKGKHITPGIIDCHSHIATDGGVNESTQAITAEVRIGDFVDGDDISIYRQLAGGVTTANVLHGSANPIGGQNQVVKMRWGVEPEDMKFAGAPAGIKFALGENVKQSNRGDDFRTRYPQTRMGVDEIINDAFRRARDYDQAWSDWRENPSGVPPRVDLELQALAEILRGERWIHCHSYRQSEILALMATCKRYDVTIGTLQHILEGYKVASEMKENGVMGSSFADWWAYKFEVYDAIPYSGSIMHKAGVVVSFNSDDSELGRRLNLEAAKAVKFGGVPPEEALKFVTLNPAKQLRIADRVGSLAVGKDADLVVWSGSPLSIYTRCEQTWIDGCCYFNLDEDNEMRQRDRARHAALVQKVLGSGAEQRKPGERDRSEIDLWPRRDLFCKCRQASEE